MGGPVTLSSTTSGNSPTSGATLGLIRFCCAANCGTQGIIVSASKRRRRPLRWESLCPSFQKVCKKCGGFRTNLGMCKNSFSQGFQRRRPLRPLILFHNPRLVRPSLLVWQRSAMVRRCILPGAESPIGDGVTLPATAILDTTS